MAMDIEKNIIEEHEYDSFEAFYDDVFERGVIRDSFLRGRYVFRGESNDKYKLIPSVLRNYDASRIKKSHNPLRAPTTNLQQYSREYANLFSFYRNANETGLKLPHVPHFKRNYTNPIPFKNNKLVFEFDEWLNEEFEELAALGQHYGLQTRLIDWTYDIKVALYFASLNACKHILNRRDTGDYFVLWALNVSLPEGFEHKDGSSYPLKLVVPPYSDNPNLNAQKGILSYWREIVNTNRHIEVDTAALDKKLSDYFAGLTLAGTLQETTNYFHFPVMYRILIPIGECFKTFKWVLDSGYNGSVLFPGYGGAVKKHEEQLLLERFAIKGFINLFIPKTDKQLDEWSLFPPSTPL